MNLFHQYFYNMHHDFRTIKNTFSKLFEISNIQSTAVFNVLVLIAYRALK